MRKILITLSLFLLLHNKIFAENILEPEKCILNALGKSSQSTSLDINVIRFNCIKLFLKSAESKAVQVNQNLLSSVGLVWFPKLITLGPPYYINESVRINVKNNSNLRLTHIVVAVVSTQNLKTEVYKFYVESAIEPFSVGYFTGSISSDSAVNTMEQFSEKYSWNIMSVYGISK